MNAAPRHADPTRPARRGTRIHAVGDLTAAKPAEAEREADVLADRAPGEQSVSLEQEADVRPYGAHGIVTDGDGSARRRDESRHQGEDRRLSAAGRADDRDEATLIDVKVDTVDGEIRWLLGRPVDLRNAAKRDAWRHRPGLCSPELRTLARSVGHRGCRSPRRPPTRRA